AAGVFGRLSAATMNVHERVFLQPALLCLPLVGPIVSALLRPDAGTSGLFTGFVAGSILQAGVAIVSVAREVPIGLRAPSKAVRRFERGLLRADVRLGRGATVMPLPGLATNAMAAAIVPRAPAQIAVNPRRADL